jgi:hypothetical protein
MPERVKLSMQQVESVLRSGLEGKWVVVDVHSASIMGHGDGVLQALRKAKANHPNMDLDDIAVMFAADLRRRANGRRFDGKGSSRKD